MSRATKWIAIFLLAASSLSCSKKDSDDGNNTANRDTPQNPVEVPTPAPTPAPPTPFEWRSVTFEDDSKLSPAFTCENRVRFTVKRDGSFSASETCSTLKQSGHITTEERAHLRGLMEDISSSQAHSKLKCKTVGPDDPKEYLKMWMTTVEMEKFTLLKQNDMSICTSGTPAEVDLLKQYLYQLQSLHLRTDVM